MVVMTPTTPSGTRVVNISAELSVDGMTSPTLRIPFSCIVFQDRNTACRFPFLFQQMSFAHFPCRNTFLAISFPIRFSRICAALYMILSRFWNQLICAMCYLFAFFAASTRRVQVFLGGIFVHNRQLAFCLSAGFKLFSTSFEMEATHSPLI